MIFCTLLVFLNVMYTASVLLQSPIGIRLCEKGCFETKGCVGFHYDPVHLRCDLQFTNINKNQQSETGVIVKRSLNKERPKDLCDGDQCLKGDQCIKTKKRGSHCVRPQELLDLPSTAGCWLERSPFFPKESRFYELSLDTMNVKPYKFAKVVHFRVVLYAPISNKLIFVNSVSHSIEAYSMNGETCVVIRRGVGLDDLALDEKRDLFFLIIFKKNHPKLQRMTTSGKDIMTLASGLLKSVFSQKLTLDKLRKTLYLIHSKNLVSYSERRIISMSYEGEDIKLITEGTGFQYIFFDHDTSVLYFSDTLNIYKKDASMRDKLIVLKSKFRYVNMQFHDGKIYTVYEHAPYTYINVTVLVSTKVTSTVLSNSTSTRLFAHIDFKMCLIP